MSYKFTRGSVDRGDIYNEDDAQQNTYLDWSEDAVGVVAGGSTIFVVSGSTALVGVGTTSPGRTLTVVGEISASSAIYGTDLVLKTNESSSIATIYIQGTNGTEIIGQSGGAMNVRSDGGTLALLGGSGNELHFGTNNIDSRMVMDTDGNLGIGTAVPDYTLDVAGDAGFNEYIYHNGDADTFIRFQDDDITIKAGDINCISFTSASQSQLICNDSGDDLDFIVRSPSQNLALYLNAGNEVFHINHGESSFKTKIHSTNGEAITVNNSGVILNEDGAAANDFRVETDNNTHMLFVGGSKDVIGIGTADPESTFHISGSQGGNYTQAAGNFTVNGTHYIVDYTGNGDATFTLPDVSDITGRVYHILCHNQSGEDVNLTVTGSGGEFQSPSFESGDQDSIRISGNTPQSITVVSTGGNWFVLNDNRAQEH